MRTRNRKKMCQPVIRKQLACFFIQPAAAAKGANRSMPVRVDVYVWLEGCDPDCTNNLAATSLQSLALRFAGKRS